MLSQTLKAIISQRLIPRKDKRGMTAAMEVLIGNELVRDEIRHGSNLEALKDTVRTSQETYGMQSFDQSLLDLFNRGIISAEEAKAQASNKKDLELALSGISR